MSVVLTEIVHLVLQGLKGTLSSLNIAKDLAPSHLWHIEKNMRGDVTWSERAIMWKRN